MQALGLLLIVSGELLRKCGMVTAGANFTHTIALRQRREHVLVEHGVYRFVRHPGYLGWYLWAVGTQVLLQNAASCALFALVVRARMCRTKLRLCLTGAPSPTKSWRFFSQRIAFEEALLLKFFGQKYVDYARHTPTWIPGIA